MDRWLGALSSDTCRHGLESWMMARAGDQEALVLLSLFQESTVGVPLGVQPRHLERRSRTDWAPPTRPPRDQAFVKVPPTILLFSPRTTEGARIPSRSWMSPWVLIISFGNEGLNSPLHSA